MLIWFDIFIFHKVQANMWSKSTQKGLLWLSERSDGFTEVGSWVGPQPQGFGNERVVRSLSILSNLKSIFLGKPLSSSVMARQHLGTTGHRWRWGCSSGHRWIHPYLHFHRPPLYTFMHWRRKWQSTPVLLPWESQGRGSLVGCCLWDRTELDTTEAT